MAGIVCSLNKNRGAKFKNEVDGFFKFLFGLIK